jgi:hypothetical protein
LLLTLRALVAAKAVTRAREATATTTTTTKRKRTTRTLHVRSSLTSVAA